MQNKSSISTGFHNVPMHKVYFLVGVNLTGGIPLVEWVELSWTAWKDSWTTATCDGKLNFTGGTDRNILVGLEAQCLTLSGRQWIWTAHWQSW